MRTEPVARRYARALFELAEERQALDDVAGALAAAVDVLGEPRIERVLAGPIDRQRKRSLVQQIAEDLRAPAVLRDFLGVLAEGDRLDQLPGIRGIFADMLDRQRGITRATVRTAAPLAGDLLAELTRGFGAVTGKQVIAQVEVDPELIAGAIVEVEGRVYDGSLRTQLHKLERQMATGE